MILLRLLAGAVLLVAGGVFVGSEFSLTRVRQFDESEFTGSRGLERAWEMTEQLEIYLSGCQFGITVTSIGLGIVVEPALTALFEPAFGLLGVGETATRAVAATVSVIVLNLVYVVIGEQVPTYLGLERTKAMAGYLSLPLWLWTKALYPAIRFSDLVAKGVLTAVGVPITRSWTEEAPDDVASIVDLRREMSEVLSGGSLPDDRRQEVINTVAIEEQPVTEIMADRETLIALSATDDLETTLDRLRNGDYDRFPLVGETLEEFHGIVYAPLVVSHLDALTDGDLTLEDLATPPMTVAAETPVSDLIDLFQTQNQELALVLEGGEVIGLVTVTDAFEAIAGEVSDPFDADTPDGEPDAVSVSETDGGSTD